MDTYPVHYLQCTYPDGESEVLAIFPQSVPDGDVNAGHVMSYAHVGQHFEASIDFCSEQESADADGYADLHRELVGIYSSGSDPVELDVVGRDEAAAIMDLPRF